MSHPIPAARSSRAPGGFRAHLPRWPGAELRWVARALRSHRDRLDQPSKLTFAVTYACQSGCQICSIWKKRPEGELSVAEIRRVLESAPRYSWVDLTGGEPFLREDIVEIAATVLEQCPSLALLHLPTNGLDPEGVERSVRAILERGPRRLIMTVSIDGPPELNVALRGHPEAWSAAIDTFDRLRRLRGGGFDVLIGSTLSGENAQAADRIFIEARKVIPGLSRDEIHWNFAQESAHYYANTGDVDGGDVNARYVQLRSLAGDGLSGGQDWASRWNPLSLVDRRYRDHLGAFIQTGRSPMPCQALRSTAFLGPTGMLYPCITWDRPLGNLRDHDYDLKRLWKSPAVDGVAREVHAGDCPQCWTPCEAVPALLGSLPRLLRGPADPSAGGKSVD